MYKLLVLLLALLFITSAANAGSGDAMKSFGLVGQWSTDCLLDPQKGGTRTTFNIPLLGSPRITLISSFKRDGLWIVRNVKEDIIEAVTITDDKIKITHTVNYSDSSARSAPPIKFDDRWTVYLKVGNKIRVAASQSVDGKKIFVSDGHIYTVRPPDLEHMVDSGVESPILEKCLN